MKKLRNKKSLLITIGVISLMIIVSAISYTYAYFAFSASNTTGVTGDAGIPKLDLTVEKITPTSANSNLKLVPLLDSAITNAVAGTGGKSSCIDANNNLSCQVYKVTLENTGTTNLVVRGRIQLSASGSNNIFQNLKWRQLENSTTVKTSAEVNNMALSTLVEKVSINVGDTKTYYFALWISEINADQSGKDYGDFKGTITFDDNAGTGVTATFTN